jgi:threonine dehydrogenase-like Zn-dependent dehydrogenase
MNFLPRFIYSSSSSLFIPSPPISPHDYFMTFRLLSDKRREEATQKILDMTNGVGVDAALECVGTGQSMATAFSIARVGTVVGAIGAPHGVVVPIDTVIFRNVGLRGGVSPVRRYIPELLDDVLEGRIHPGLVFDFTTDLSGFKEAYHAMNERRAIKSLLQIGTI